MDAGPHAAEGTVRVDAGGRVTGCDEAFARMVGASRDRVVGELLSDLVRPDEGHLREREQLLLQVESLVASLQEAIDARDEFLSVASHELKTPLTALQLQIEGVLRSAARGVVEVPEAVRDKLASVVRQGRRLGQLVTDLLDVARIRGGRIDLKLEPVDLGQVAADAAERFRQEAILAGSDLVCRLAGPVVGLWDRTRLEQVAGNLVSNAIKYGNGMPIEVRVSRHGPVARLEVADRGIGIALDQQERIFQRFERAVPARQFGGMGLGLWITREIVSRLCGVVRVESAPGEGSTFTVELPLPQEVREMEPGAGA